MKSAPVVLGMMLAVSLLFNVVAFVRLGEEAAPAAAPKPSAPPAARSAGPTEHPVEAAPLPRAAEAAPRAPEGLSVPAAPKSAAAPAATSSLRNDPKVREVLQANDAFNAFWKDLERVFKVRSKFDEAKYAQTVMTATSEYLELSDSARTQFEEAAKAAAASYAQARKEHEAAKRTLPPKDKNNPTTYAAYQQQKDVIDARYDSQVKAAVDSLKPYLSAGDPRHQEFAQSAEKWLKNLAPRPTQP